MEKGLVTKIVKDSILDGPGCRYVVFIKGCNLACPWCHNPETQLMQQEILTYPQFCIQCGKCIQVAPADVPKDVMPVKVDNSRVDQFKACVEECPTRALEYAGKEYTTDQIIDEMMKYQTMYKRTGGGLTISGGDPLCNHKFTLELLQKASQMGFHTAVDTAGAFQWEYIKTLMDYVDLWLYDLKHTRDESLKTSQSLDNLLLLSKSRSSHVFIRIPIIPEYNDYESIWKEMAYYINKAKNVIERIDLLPFHPFGLEKYQALGRSFFFKDQKELDEDTLNKAREAFGEYLPKEMIHIGRNMVHG